MPEIDEQVKTGVAQALAELGVTKETMADLAKMKEVKRAEIGERTTNVEVGEDPKMKFKSLSETLRAVKTATTRGQVDPRLTYKAATGLGEGISVDGGFLLQPQISSGLIQRVYEIGQITSRCQKITIGSGSNTLKLNAVDETSRASTRMGGIVGYWLEEAGTITASKPKFRVMTLDLKKVGALFYATDELLQDLPAMETVVSNGCAQELAFQVESAIFSGNGVGKPLGIQAGNAHVTVAKETAPAQAAATILTENIFKMWSRMYAPCRANAAWYINQDCEPQLFSLYKVVGVGGVPVYMPANGLSEKPYGTLMGRPVIPVEYAETLGSEGDITLADFSQYILADKGDVQAASSIHVEFLTDQQCFRFIYRVDGQPIWSQPLTPHKGTNTVSPFVNLAARA